MHRVQKRKTPLLLNSLDNINSKESRNKGVVPKGEKKMAWERW